MEASAHLYDNIYFSRHFSRHSSQLLLIIFNHDDEGLPNLSLTRKCKVSLFTSPRHKIGPISLAIPVGVVIGYGLNLGYRPCPQPIEHSRKLDRT
ncbi:hypothetical protein BDW66DRAFT_141832 [Aspergillus desertorum]